MIESDDATVEDLLHLPPDHSLNRLAARWKRSLRRAQEESVEREFPDAALLFARACEDLRLAVAPPPELRGKPATALADQSGRNLTVDLTGIFASAGVPESERRRLAATLAHRIHLRRAFADPDAAIEATCDKVVSILRGFPREAGQLLVGRNPGDVLDPYILAAVRMLVCGGNFEAAVSATVSHKALMMIEDLMGHLHEDVLGRMRGNVRAPEPRRRRGRDQEVLDPQTNPFPGADIVQPPTADGRGSRFHQVKSKTGSAKGGDAKRIADQLVTLKAAYGGELFFDALVGNTLRGHRSRGGIRKVSGEIVLLVGQAAFAEITGSPVGPELLLDLYRKSFEVAVSRHGYDLEDVTARIFASFNADAKRHGEGYLETLLHAAISGPPEEQDSRRPD